MNTCHQNASYRTTLHPHHAGHPRTSSVTRSIRPWVATPLAMLLVGAGPGAAHRGGPEGGASAPPRASAPQGLPTGFVHATPLGAAPDSRPALSPSEARSRVKTGDRVTLIGRVGGSVKPFVDGRAIMTIVDSSLPSCADRPGDNCARPWDYCCETRQEIAARSATIQVVDERGAPLRVDLKGVGGERDGIDYGIRELSEVTVEGTVAAVGDRVLVLSAERIYVNPELTWNFFLRERPEKPVGVKAVQDGSGKGETVTMVGRIPEGGIERDRAVFTLLDSWIKPCGAPSAEACTTDAAPACATHETPLRGLFAARVRLVDASGTPLALDLRGRRGLAPGAEVVVRGKLVDRRTSNNTEPAVVDAEAIYVVPARSEPKP